MRAALRVVACSVLVLLGRSWTPAWGDPVPKDGGLAVALDLGQSAEPGAVVQVGAQLKGRVVFRNVSASAMLVPAKGRIRIEVSFVEEGSPIVGAAFNGPTEILEDSLQTLRPQEELVHEFEVEIRRSGLGAVRAELKNLDTAFIRVGRSPQGTVARERIEASQLWRGTVEASAVVTAVKPSLEKFKGGSVRWRAVARLFESPVADVGGALALLFSWREAARNEAGIELLERIVRSDAPTSLRECSAAMMLAGVKEGWSAKGIDVLLGSDSRAATTAMQELRLEAAGLGSLGYLKGSFEVRGVVEKYSSNLSAETRAASTRILSECVAGPDGWLRQRASVLLQGLPAR